MREIIEKRNSNKEESKQKKDILSLMLKGFETSQENFTENQLFSEMIVFLVAG